MEWLSITLGGGGLFVGVGAVLLFISTRKRDRSTDIAERFDDASELAKYIREEVERQVAPIRAELKTVKEESHEMHGAVRARETQLWLWDQRGRQGGLPMLPTPILERLNLGHLVEDWPTEPIHPT